MQDYNHYEWSLFGKVVVLSMDLNFSRCTYVQKGRYVKFSKKYLNIFWGNKSFKMALVLTSTLTSTNSFIVEECCEGMINDC